MRKLSENTPEPQVPRIYRLRTNDEDYQISWESEVVFHWQEMWDEFLENPRFPVDEIEEKVAQDVLRWTVEYMREPEADEDYEAANE